MFGLFSTFRAAKRNFQRVEAGLVVSIPDLSEWAIKTITKIDENYISIEIENAIVTACNVYTKNDDKKLEDRAKDKLALVDLPTRIWINSLGNKEDLKERRGENGRIGFGMAGVHSSGDLLIKLYMEQVEVQSILHVMKSNYKEREIESVDRANEFIERYRDKDAEPTHFRASGNMSIMFSIFWLLSNDTRKDFQRLKNFNIDEVEFNSSPWFAILR